MKQFRLCCSEILFGAFKKTKYLPVLKIATFLFQYFYKVLNEAYNNIPIIAY